MFRRSAVTVIFALMLAGCGQKPIQLTPHIVPVPARLTTGEGVFEIKSSTSITTDGSEGAAAAAAVLQQRFKTVAGWDLSLTEPGETSGAIVIRSVGDTALGLEGYRFNASVDEISIEAHGEAGLFYGVQTLFQLLPEAIYSRQKAGKVKWRLPAVFIEDQPRFAYRGMHLDVCRHIFPVSYIKQYIDYLAMHKMNRFHWHLTEDQGWRIEIKKYPKLQSIASRRKETQLRKTNLFDGKPYGGFYTQDEVKEVVAYAAERHVMVIPEIEMPGHSVAALTAYPELSCNGGPFEVRTRWGISKDIYCAGNEKTFEFLENVLTEVMDLFPAPYIHIGGDEAPKDRWDDCAKCRRRIHEEGLKNSHELQSWFIRRIETFLNAHGKRIIGWDEILEGGLAPNATVMSWRGIAGGVAAARQGHDVIMTPNTHLYFDYYQADATMEPLAIGGLSTLENVYSYEPLPESLTPDEARHILGAQANLWTEYIETTDYADYMALPRMSALAEVVWSPREKRDWTDFQRRVQPQYKRFSAMGAAYRIPTPVLKGSWVIASGDTLIIEPGVAGASVTGTTNGKEPGPASSELSTLVPDENMILKIQTTLPDGRVSSVLRQPVLLKDKAPAGESYGLSYTVYTGKVERFMPQAASLKRWAKGVTYDLDLDDLAHPKDQFYIEFSGKIWIPAGGTYTFHIRGDDGATLTIDGHRVAGHKQYSYQPVMGNMLLEQGAHSVRINYFDYQGRESLTLEVEGPGLKRQPVPPWMWLK